MTTRDYNPLGIASGDQRSRERETHAPAVSGPQDNLTHAQLDTAEIWAWKICMAMLHQNPAMAHELVDLGILELKPQAKSPILTTLLIDIGIEPATCSLLEKHCGIITIGDLLEPDVSINTLLAVPSLGEGRVLNLALKLANVGIKRAVESEQKETV